MTETTMEPVLASALAHGQLPLHPRMRLVWGLNHGVVNALAFTAVLVPLSVKFDWMPVIVTVLLALTAGLGLGWRHAGHYAARYAALHLGDGVLIRRGVWWRSELFVPRARIQHTEVHQGPLDRRWGMAGVSIHTAGTRLESITLPGVPHAIALQLRDALLDRRTHADGA
jgi:hypothetical protein